MTTAAAHSEAAARPQLAAVGPASRKRFLSLSGLVVSGAAGLVAACGEEAPRRAPPPPDAKSDLEILNFFLRLERVEAAFYDEVLGRRLLDGQASKLASTFAEHEREHVAILEKLVTDLGGSVGRAFETDFPMEHGDDAVALGRGLEELGADAYLGQLRRIRRDDALNMVVSIYTVEARHAAALNELAEERPYTPGGPFAKPVGMAEALEQLERYIR